jgi:hypothetical protein
VKEDALQSPPSFFMGNIGEKEEVEALVSAGEGRGLYPEIKGFAAALLPDPAFLGITVFRLVQEGSGFGRAAGGTEDGGAAAQNAVHCMLAGQGVPGFFPQHLGKRCCAKETQKGLIGENDLPGMVENQDKAGESVQNVQQLTVAADGFALAFDFSPRTAQLLGCFGRAEVVVHSRRQGLSPEWVRSGLLDAGNLIPAMCFCKGKTFCNPLGTGKTAGKHAFREASVCQGRVAVFFDFPSPIA